MLKIRLQRTGKKSSPSFRVVVTEKTTGPRGKPVEVLGSYNTRLKNVQLKSERIQYWLGKGAQASDTVHNLLIKEKIIEGKKIPMHKTKKKDESPAVGEVQVQEAPPEAQALQASSKEVKEAKPEEKPNLENKEVKKQTEEKAETSPKT